MAKPVYVESCVYPLQFSVERSRIFRYKEVSLLTMLRNELTKAPGDADNSKWMDGVVLIRTLWQYNEY